MNKPETREKIVDLVENWRATGESQLVMAYLLSCAELAADGYAESAELAAKKLFKLVK